MEAKVKEALLTMTGELAGTYKSLTEMTKEEKNALIEEHILFNDADDKSVNFPSQSMIINSN